MTGAVPSTDARIRIPDFSILHCSIPLTPHGGRMVCYCADITRTDDWLAQHRTCFYCRDAFGYDVPIYRDPLNDGELTAHLSCAIEHDEVRVWTPEDFAAPWRADINAGANPDASTHAAGTEQLLSAIASNGTPSVACKHLSAFAEFYADSSVVIMCDTPMGCCMCDVTLSAEEFSVLLVRALTPATAPASSTPTLAS